MRRVLFFALVLFSALQACKSEQTDSTDAEDPIVNSELLKMPYSAEGDDDLDDLPKIQFDEPVYDFGTIKYGESIKHDFKFTNTGKKPLLINNASGTCGCLVPEYTKKPIEPGEQGVLTITYNSEGRVAGQQEKTVTVLANTIPNTTNITIKVKVTD